MHRRTFLGPSFSTALRVQELREGLLLSTELTKELIFVGKWASIYIKILHRGGCFSVCAAAFCLRRRQEIQF